MKKYVIVDIDGTISKVGDRLYHIQGNPKDWDSFYERCDEDEPIDTILNLVEDLKTVGYRIVYCTGRRESCRKATIQWLKDQGMSVCNCLNDYNIYMRKDGDYRHDTEVKPELLDKFIKLVGISKDDIAFILEDRTSMVKKWRELGYTCLQVANGDF